MTETNSSQIEQRHRPHKKIVFFFVAALLGTMGGFALVVRGVVPVPSNGFVWRSDFGDTEGYRPAGRIETGVKDEIVLVYIGSAGCVWSNTPELPGIVEKLKNDLYDWSVEQDLGFVAIGVGRDVSVAAGVEHLGKFGLFDEVFAGRSWANSAVQEYVYGRNGGLGATPQVVILLRRSDYQSTGKVRRMGERVLVRLTGLDEISVWEGTGGIGLSDVVLPSVRDTVRHGAGLRPGISNGTK